MQGLSSGLIRCHRLPVCAVRLELSCGDPTSVAQTFNGNPDAVLTRPGWSAPRLDWTNFGGTGQEPHPEAPCSYRCGPRDPGAPRQPELLIQINAAGYGPDRALHG